MKRFASILVALFACGGEDTQPPANTIEIAGTWSSNFGGTEVINESSWAEVPVVEYSNSDNFAVTRNPDDAEFNPGKFNKLVWTDPQNNSFYYCFVDFGRDTALAAKTSTHGADATNPEAGGCGMFSWTKLTRS